MMKSTPGDCRTPPPSGDNFTHCLAGDESADSC
jgi:hypothetical protein